MGKKGEASQVGRKKRFNTFNGSIKAGGQENSGTVTTVVSPGIRCDVEALLTSFLSRMALTSSLSSKGSLTTMRMKQSHGSPPGPLKSFAEEHVETNKTERESECMIEFDKIEVLKSSYCDTLDDQPSPKISTPQKEVNLYTAEHTSSGLVP